jgi:hypothetical protein
MIAATVRGGMNASGISAKVSDLDRDSHRYLTRNDAWTLVENVSIPVLRSHATLEDPYALGGAIVTRMGRDRSRARSSGRLAAR